MPLASEGLFFSGVERTIEGRHVLLLNFRERTDRVRTFEDLAGLRRYRRGLVIAAHPDFPDRSCCAGGSIGMPNYSAPGMEPLPTRA